MAMTKAQQTGNIVRVPGVVGGEPVIKGTRIPVRSVVVAYQEAEGDLGQVLRAYPQLNEAVVLEALAFYQRHRVEIDRAIARNEQVAMTGA